MPIDPDIKVADGNKLEETEYDVVVVGSGAAALTAALTAGRDGASVVVLEGAEQIGGTTAKSSGGYWIPQNRLMRERAKEDERFLDVRDNCLAHMARLSYPDTYVRGAERHGLDELQWNHIVEYYDHAAEVVEDLESTGDLTMMWLGSFRGDDLGLPTWFETEEDGNTYGRLLAVTPYSDERAAIDAPFSLAAKNTNNADAAMKALGAAFGDGVDLVLRLAASVHKYGGTIVTEHRVSDIVVDVSGAAVGVVADTPDGPVTVTARRAVVFGTGGMEHDKELRERFLRGPLVGSCGAGTNRGDFIHIAERHGIALGNTREAWWATLPLEPCIESFEQGELMNQIYGDSTISVNGTGRRVSNEKESYNERGKIHSARPEDGYPNRILIQILDDAIIQDQSEWPARWPVPKAPDIPDYVLQADTLEELTDKLTERLAELEAHTSGYALAPDFLENLKDEIERFNGFARSGVDEDFGRGKTWAQRYFSVEFREESMPNFTMYPIADTGPYYAILYGASCLGTKGGPQIDTRSQILRADGEPFPGLFGAGNCIASPTGEAYWGGGSTLGPAIVNGYWAGKSAAQEPVRAGSSAQSAA